MVHTILISELQPHHLSVWLCLLHSLRHDYEACPDTTLFAVLGAVVHFEELHSQVQGRSQDFSRGNPVCGNFASHTHFFKTTCTPIIRKLRATAFNNLIGCFYTVAHKRVAS